MKETYTFNTTFYKVSFLILYMFTQKNPALHMHHVHKQRLFTVFYLVQLWTAPCRLDFSDAS